MRDAFVFPVSMSRMPRTYERNRQDRIAQVAAEIIGESGPERATIRAIAERCGISKGVVEHHFADKKDILRKTLQWVNARFIEQERRCTLRKRGLAASHARLRCLIPLTPAAVQDWKLRVHFWSMTLGNPGDHLDMSGGLAGIRDRFCEDLRQALECREIPASVAPLQAANMLLHLAGGVAWNMFVDPAYYNRRYRARIVDRIMDDLRQGRVGARHRQ